MNLRAEVTNERRAAGATDADADTAALAFADAVKRDWRTAALALADQALCLFAEKLTRTPSACTAADVAALRAAGLSDPAVHDAAQVIAYFNYVNRVSHALGVDLEPEMRRAP